MTPEAFWSRVDKSGGPDACWRWTRKRFAQGYGRFQEKLVIVRTHRRAFMLANGYEAPDFVLHSCDNPICCNPGHLRNGTHADNMNDMKIRGRGRPPRGEHNGNAKLSKAAASEIRETVGNLNALAEKFGVSRTVIAGVRRGDGWPSCETPPQPRHTRTGEGAYQVRLTEADIRAIRTSTEPYSVLTKRYGLHSGSISRIRNFLRWKHVSPQEADNG